MFRGKRHAKLMKRSGKLAEKAAAVGQKVYKRIKPRPGNTKRAERFTAKSARFATKAAAAGVKYEAKQAKKHAASGISNSISL